MMIWLGLYSRLFSRLNLRDTAAFSSGMPSTAVYFEARPDSIALMAAALMFAGVSKSGSPAPSPITSRPACLSARALSVTAMVGEGLMRFRVSERKAIGFSAFGRAVGSGREHRRQAEKPGISMKTDDDWHHGYGPLAFLRLSVRAT